MIENRLKSKINKSGLENRVPGDVVKVYFDGIINNHDDILLVFSGLHNGIYEFLEEQFKENNGIIWAWQQPKKRTRLMEDGSIIMNSKYRISLRYNPNNSKYKEKKKILMEAGLWENE